MKWSCQRNRFTNLEAFVSCTDSARSSSYGEVDRRGRLAADGRPVPAPSDAHEDATRRCQADREGALAAAFGPSADRWRARPCAPEEHAAYQV